MNPYTNTDFFSFFFVLLKRLFGLIPLANLPSDEIQLLVLSGVALSCALVGTFLILRNMAMLANSLSHTILLGIVVVHLLTSSANGLPPIGALVLASIVMGFVTSFLTEWIAKNFRLQSDASNGLVFTTLFAVGILLTSVFANHAHLGTEAIMGNADALHPDDLSFVWGIAFLNLLVVITFYFPLQITTFDPGFATASGYRTSFYHYLVMFLLSLTAVGAFRAVGVLMVLTFLVVPPIVARLFFNRLPYVLIAASAVGIVGSIVGVALSRHLLTVYNLPLSTSGLTVCVFSLLFSFALLFSPKKGVVARYLSKKKWKKRSLP